MKREDFMKYAEREIENAFRGQRNRMMNLVEQAWAEGKKNAEINGVKSIVESVIDEMGLKKVENAVNPDSVYSERKGTWKDNGNGTISCSECGTWFPKEREPFLQFCGYCGAKNYNPL